jgi:hypothetical protein
MYTLRYTTSILFLLLFSTSNYAQKIVMDFDSSIDYAKYKTYAWLAPGDSVLNRIAAEKLYGGSITNEANQELKARGLKLVTDKPDVVFQFYTGVEEFTKYSQSPTLSVGVAVAIPAYYGGAGYYGGPGAYYVGASAPVAGGKITATTMDDGTLAYSMFDTRTGKLVWTARVSKTFKPTDDISKIIRDYTEKIFKKYPIKKGKS